LAEAFRAHPEDWREKGGAAQSPEGAVVRTEQSGVKTRGRTMAALAKETEITNSASALFYRLRHGQDFREMLAFCRRAAK